MALNPELVSTGTNLVPALFPNESLLLRREHVKLEIDQMPTVSGRWSAKGALFLSNIRMIFVPHKTDPKDNLSGIDLPLIYIRKDKFNQPVFGCNNLSGECWSVGEEGGPTGTLPPHAFKMSFIEGGVGTFLPLYFTFITLAREAEKNRKSAEQLSSHEDINTKVAQAFVDPSDPTLVYLTQPLGDEARLPTAPKYAANFGANEAYLPLV